MTKDNRQLGKFELSGIPPAPRGVPQIEVSFNVDANGILQVKAQDKASGKAKEITITNDKGRLSEEEIQRMVDDAEKFAKEDTEFKNKIEARNKLESYLYSVRSSCDDTLKDKLDDEAKEKVKTTAKDALSWLDSNQDASTDDYESKQKEIEAIISPIFSATYKTDGDDANTTSSNDADSAEEVPQDAEVEEEKKE